MLLSAGIIKLCERKEISLLSRRVYVNPCSFFEHVSYKMSIAQTVENLREYSFLIIKLWSF